MNRRSWPVGLVITTLALAGWGQEAQAQATSGHADAALAQAPGDWTAVEKAMGRSGALQPGDVYKFGLPRGDLTVTVDRVQLQPTLALGSWVAFQATSAGAIAMGDLVLRDDEVEPAMAKLAAGGIQVTALHHHVLHETPRVYYMHVHGAGDPVRLAHAIRAAVDVTRTPAPAAGLARLVGRDYTVITSP